MRVGTEGVGYGASVTSGESLLQLTSLLEGLEGTASAVVLATHDRPFRAGRQRDITKRSDHGASSYSYESH